MMNIILLAAGTTAFIFCTINSWTLDCCGCGWYGEDGGGIAIDIRVNEIISIYSNIYGIAHALCE